MRAPFARNIFDLVCEVADRHPERPVAYTLDDTMTYAQLAARAKSVARRLRNDGIRRGDRVGLIANNCFEWLEVCIGTAATGATLVPFSTWSTADELAFLIEDSAVRVLFSVTCAGDRQFAADIDRLKKEGPFPHLERVVLLDGPDRSEWEQFHDYRSSAPLGPLAPGDGTSARDPFVVLYTSGSSNRPKAVPLEHAAAIENGFNIGERQGYGADDRVLVSIPLFWSYGAVNALPAILTHGAALVLQPRFEPGGALDLIEKRQCTALYTLPAMTSALVGHPSFSRTRTQTLRTGLTIGSPQDVMRAANELGAAGICNIYGSTETYGNCCVTWHHWPLERRAACQGPPLPGVTVRIREPGTGRRLGSGEVGEVEVTGYLTPGYDGLSARHNAEVFTQDGFFRTADLGSLDAEGNFSYAGRSSEMIKRSGINVSPAEVEEVLQQHSDVALAGVTGAPDPTRGEIIVAYVVARADAELDPDALISYCREKMSRYKVPDRLEVRESLPLTPTGKLMRRALKAMASAGE